MESIQIQCDSSVTDGEAFGEEKTEQLAANEIAELDAIGELGRIFTRMNAMLAAQTTT